MISHDLLTTRVMRRFAAAMFVLAALLVAPVPQAAPITFVFTGHVNSANLDPASPFPDLVDFDTPFSGSYTFETTTPDAVVPPTDLTGSQGSYPDPTGVFALQLGGLSFAFNGVTIVTFNTPGFDSYGVDHSENPDDTGTPTGIILQINLPGLDDTALASDALPIVPPSLARFDTTNAFFFTDTIDDNQIEVQGRLDSLSILSVPEPAPVALLAIGLLAMSLRRRR